MPITTTRPRVHDRVTLEAVSAILVRYLAVYRHRKPFYQTLLLRQLAEEWGDHRSVLDVGAGTGVLGQAMHELFAADVTSIDIHDRYVKGLTTRVLVYDGKTLPFADHAFDAVVINNVLHHVPLPLRERLLRECHRVCDGPVYIKDHLAATTLDHVRLTVLDAIGNIPFGGMVSAHYLTVREWEQLAASTGYGPPSFRSAAYRSGLFAMIFPNGLEIITKWVPA
jgi:SAM-dependent methyltransferase